MGLSLFCPSGDGCVLEVKVMTGEELLERYARRDRKTSIDLRGCDLSEKNLFMLELSIDLREVNFDGAILDSAQLNGADLRGASFIGAQCTRTYFCGCLLDNCIMRDACIDEGFFCRSSLTSTDMTGSNCEEASFHYANLKGVNFSRANLKMCRFEGANLQKVNFTDAILEEANFLKADLRGAIGLNLQGAILGNTIMPDGSVVTDFTVVS
jgi:uncharacterized protein YjbI with pentapeptide repeats